MKSFINIVTLLFFLYTGYYCHANLNGIFLSIGVFFSGLIIGVLLMNILLNVKNDKINIYKRKLEKESVSSDEASAKVQILESKINVLEKALENALKK